METVVERWDLVIKVNYGNVLKRFVVCVHGDTIDYDMSKLRRKIIDLFKLDPNTDLILSYVDEDSDVVSLDNDDELWDAAITQNLNPLRINVQLKSNIAKAPDVKHDVLNPTCASHPRNISPAIDEPMRYFSRPPLYGFNDLPTLPPLPKFSEMMGLSNIQRAINSTGDSLGIHVEATTRSNNVDVKGKQKASNAYIHVSSPSYEPFPVQIHNALSQTADEFVKMDISTGEASRVSDEEATESTDLHPEEEPRQSNISVPLPKSSVEVPFSFPRLDKKNGITNDLNLDYYVYPSLSNSIVHSSNDSLAYDWASDKNMAYDNKYYNAILHGKSIIPTFSQKAEEQSKYGLKPNYAPTYGVGISSFMDGGKGKISTDTAMSPANQDLCFPQGYNDSLLHTSPRVMKCDGCGLTPIIGQTFKYKLKDDHLLCNVCFFLMLNEAAYTDTGRTHSLSPHEMLKEYTTITRPETYPYLLGFAANFPRMQLESCFIQHVTVLDGTVMPPSTPFTKIWRMRNNGSVKWPYGTQLVWDGGYQFANRHPVQLKIPLGGLQVNEEIDISVDIVSPPTSGSYISYWKLASPSGQKFGQRVWVLILINIPFYRGDFDLNLPPEDNDVLFEESEGSNDDGLGVNDANTEPSDDVPFKPFVSNSIDKLVEAFDKEFDNQVQAGTTNVEPVDNEIPHYIVSPDTNNVVAKPTPGVTPLSYPLFPLSPLEASLIANVPPFVPFETETETETEDVWDKTMPKELEDMGFMCIDLNKEILGENSYDLEQSVDDLCAFPEWDLHLAELYKMGFHDRSKNKKLMMKNGGSIKQVVLDLLSEGE